MSVFLFVLFLMHRIIINNKDLSDSTLFDIYLVKQCVNATAKTLTSGPWYGLPLTISGDA